MPAQAERGWQSRCAHRAAWLLHDHQKSTGWDEELCQRLARGGESSSRESGAEWSNFSEGGVPWRSYPLHQVASESAFRGSPAVNIGVT